MLPRGPTASVNYAAWPAAGPRFSTALDAYLRRLWIGAPLSNEDRVGLTCFIPKEAIDKGALPLRQYKIAAALANLFLAGALPVCVDERHKGFIHGRLGSSTWCIWS